MNKLINLSIDLTKVPKEVIVTKDKNGQPFTNGAKYLNLTLSVSDDADQFGNHASAWLNQTQEQRANKENKKFVGNGKTFWSGHSQQQEKQEKGINNENHVNNVDEDDLPF